MISFILVSKNDNYENGSLNRLKTSLKTNIETAKKYTSPDCQFEFILGDWGSDEPLTKELLNLKGEDNLKIYYFPKEITSKFNSSFNEVHSLNFLIRNSQKEYVARLDQDIIVGDEFFTYIKNIQPNKFYWSVRRDLSKDQINGSVSSTPLNMNPNDPLFYRAAIGIILAHKKTWCNIKGYNENMIFRNHMEHDLYERFKNCLGNDSLVNLGSLINAPFYHLWHERKEGLSRQMNNLTATFNNDENWGLNIYKDIIIQS